MSIREQTTSEAVIRARERYVARGISTPPLVVAHAEGARIEDVDGRSYIDFAGGLGVSEHGPRGSRRPRSASRRTATSTSASWSGSTSPTSKSAASSTSSRPAGAGAAQPPRQHGRRGGRERGQDRPRRNRQAGCPRLRAGVPRPDAPDDDHDEQGRALQAGLRAVRARGLPSPGAVPLPWRHLRRRDCRRRATLQGRGRPGHSCLRRPRARAGRGAASSRCRRTSGSGCRSSSTATGSCSSPTRCRAASGEPEPSGRSSSTRSNPTCSSRPSRSAVDSRSAPSRALRR